MYVRKDNLGALNLYGKPDGQRAFRMLVKASQDANLRLNAVAQWLIDDHTSKLPSEG